MSLENLINTATTEFGISREEVVKHFIDFIENYLTKEFGDKEDFPYITQIIKVLTKFELLNTTFRYTCNDYLVTGSASSFDKNCLYCGNKINVSTDKYKHELKVVHEMKKKSVHTVYQDLIELQHEIELKHYLMEGYKVNLDDLISVKDKVVPFIGSGVSTPFNLPNWADMLRSLKDHLPENRWGYYEELIFDGDYLEALSLMKKSSQSLDTDRRIQERIQSIFEEDICLDIPVEKHNYKDLIALESDFYLTTNYDNILTSLRARDSNFIPSLTWSDIDNLQKFLIQNKGSVIHLHGVIHKPTSMIVTKENYHELYEDENFHRILTTFMANRVLFFIGFSFNDQFFYDLFENILDKISGDHYLLAPNITRSKAKELSQKGLKVIGLNIQTSEGKLDKSDLIYGIRCVLKTLH